jgi:pimeloyl-ACP methyl ester carboxylesterase
MSIRRSSLVGVARHSVLAAGMGVLILILCVTVVRAQADPTANGKTVILVHGAFADGSSWRRVISLLRAKGLRVVAVQNPLTSLADDCAATQRAIDRVDGPVILVGHSYAGTVITQVGADPRVVGLVYVAAIAPDAGQSVNDLLTGVPPSPAADQIKPDAAGFLTITSEGMRDDFAQDVPAPEAEILTILQGPIAGSAFRDKVTVAAWKSKPSWYIVSNRDRAVSPDLERTMARHIGARTVTLPTSHMAMLSRPERVAAVIAEAAESTDGR